MNKIFVIAEIGINHNGDINVAKDLILLAKNSGCDAVKFQKRTIEIVLDNQIIIIDLIKNIVSDENDVLLFQTSNFEMKNTYSYQMDYFINCLKQNEKPMNSLKESIEVLKIVL